jgi:hypothetical protein
LLTQRVNEDKSTTLIERTEPLADKGLKMKTWILLFGLLSMLSTHAARASVEITQDEQFVYYKYHYFDMDDANQKEARNQFLDVVNKKLQAMNLPHQLLEIGSSQAADAINALTPTVSSYQKAAISLRNNRGATVADGMPVGMFFAFGANGSYTTAVVPVGVGGSLMVDGAFAPIVTIMLNKGTGAKTVRWELNADIGVLFQVGGGLSESIGYGARGMVGFIWGDLPDSSKLIGGGFAVGGAVDINLFGGTGLTALSIKNPDTHLRNLLIVRNWDLGSKAGAEAHVVFYYFADQNTGAKWFHADTPDNFVGGHPAAAATATTPTTTPVTPPTVPVTPPATPVTPPLAPVVPTPAK